MSWKKHNNDQPESLGREEPSSAEQDSRNAAGQGCGDKADPLYRMLKPLHNLPRGKNTWDPKFIRKRWFWPVSALVLVILFYIYPRILDFFR